MLYGGVWYRAEILAVDGEKRKVHYQDFSSAFDEWVTPDRIKPRGAPAPKLTPPPAAVASQFTGLYYRSVILPKDPSLSGGAAVRTYPYWFLPDGHVLGGDWKAIDRHYLRHRRVSDFQQQFPNSWGTFALQGEAIEINWVGDRQESRKVEADNGRITISGLHKAWSFPKGHQIIGTYLGLEGGGKMDGETSGVFYFEFGPDNFCRYSESLSVQIGEKRESSGKRVERIVGKYLLDDFSLTVTQPDGTLFVFSTWAYGSDETKEQSPAAINIGGAIYRLEKK